MTISDADVGRSVNETQRILDALAFKDEFGEGCPADWQKGDKGLDYAGQMRTEGPVDISTKKSWGEWARPKLQRAWSNTSQRSSGSLSRPTSMLAFSVGPNLPASPMLSPTSWSGPRFSMERNLEASAMNLGIIPAS